MNELMKAGEQTQKTITSVDLVKEINMFRKEEGNRAELRHDTLRDIIRDELDEEVNSQQILEIQVKGKTNSTKAYVLTLSQAKRVLLRESKYVRRAVIGYLDKIEKVIKEQQEKAASLPQTYLEALKALVASEEKRLEVERKNAILMHVNATYTATEIAKELNMKSANELNKALSDMKIQYKVGKTWVLYSQYSNKGYEEIKQETLDNGKVVYHRKFTQLGRDFILGLFDNKVLTK